MAGKGSRARYVDRPVYDANFDNLDWNTIEREELDKVSGKDIFDEYTRDVVVPDRNAATSQEDSGQRRSTTGAST